MRYIGEQDQKLIAAVPADGVGAAHAAVQTMRDRLQQLVAHRMARESLTGLKRSRSTNKTRRNFRPVGLASA